MVEPKTAIACRDEVEKRVVLDILKREGHTTDLSGISAPIRVYICPKGYKDFASSEHDDLMQCEGEDVDYCYVDEDDDFEWNYVEASSMFRNQIISARIKGG